MKTFKDVEALTRRLKKSIAWEDYFRLGGKVFNLYEYGPGPGVNLGFDYIYFRNKRTGDMVYIKYDCPSYQYRDGVKVQTKQYAFRDIEYIPNATTWR